MPNAGKSTLVNLLTGQTVSVINPKAQTTRHRILGILNGTNYQVVFSDTPGFTKPAYLLHNQMNRKVEEAISDADILMWVIDISSPKAPSSDLELRIQSTSGHLLILLNKIDLAGQEATEKAVKFYTEKYPKAIILPISAANKFGTPEIMKVLLDWLPEHPPYFEGDDYTDRTMRFYVSEIIRNNILKYYDKEIPYSIEVVVNDYIEEERIDKISCDIIVARDSQKGIILGEGGKAIKKLGIKSRREIEQITGKKVFLALYVKVDKNWRDNPQSLKKYGYE
jgi:GTP-binding protein Era